VGQRSGLSEDLEQRRACSHCGQRYTAQDSGKSSPISAVEMTSPAAADVKMFANKRLQMLLLRRSREMGSFAHLVILNSAACFRLNFSLLWRAPLSRSVRALRTSDLHRGKTRKCASVSISQPHRLMLSALVWKESHPIELRLVGALILLIDSRNTYQIEPVRNWCPNSMSSLHPQEINIRRCASPAAPAIESVCEFPARNK
jgi:hypothetical protein